MVNELVVCVWSWKGQGEGSDEYEIKDKRRWLFEVTFKRLCEKARKNFIKNSSNWRPLLPDIIFVAETSWRSKTDLPDLSGPDDSYPYEPLFMENHAPQLILLKSDRFRDVKKIQFDHNHKNKHKFQILNRVFILIAECLINEDAYQWILICGYHGPQNDQNENSEISYENKIENFEQLLKICDLLAECPECAKKENFLDIGHFPPDDCKHSVPLDHVIIAGNFNFEFFQNPIVKTIRKNFLEISQKFHFSFCPYFADENFELCRFEKSPAVKRPTFVDQILIKNRGFQLRTGEALAIAYHPPDLLEIGFKYETDDIKLLSDHPPIVACLEFGHTAAITGIENNSATKFKQQQQKRPELQMQQNWPERQQEQENWPERYQQKWSEQQQQQQFNDNKMAAVQPPQMNGVHPQKHPHEVVPGKILQSVSLRVNLNDTK